MDLPSSSLRPRRAEAALLAGIPRAPSRINPFTHPERSRIRQGVVLHRMHALGLVDADQLEEALAEPLRLVPPERGFAAPHFTSWALGHADLRGSTGPVQTSLDLELQRETERLVRQTVRHLVDRGVSQAAVVVLENAGGGVLAWVGSADFFDPADGQVDMVVGRRQPGSTLKPFVYGLGLEHGLTAATLLPDLPLWFPTALGDYRPRNYDRRFHGWVRLRDALANSYNVPAVWMAHLVGVAAVHARLRALGFDSLGRTPHHYRVGLALGNGEVRLLDLANAYRTLANEGVRTPVRWRLEAPSEATTRVMPVLETRLLTDILSDPVARVPAFGRHNVLSLPFPAAVKTGTSVDFTDNWTVGFTSEVTVAVWVGNFDGRPMKGVSGVTGAGTLWHRVMRAAMQDRRPRSLSTAGLVPTQLCRDVTCAHRYHELFVPGTEPGSPVGQGKPPEVLRPRVTFPDSGDVFTADADTPSRYARLRLRAEAPSDVEALVWEIDGGAQPSTPRPFARWWPVRAGAHVLRVWPDGRPDEASAPVRFKVLE